MSQGATPTEIPFGEAYEELKGITERLNNEDVEPDQLVPILRRGKGLEAACRDHLTGIEQEIQAIEAGDGVQPFKIVAAESTDADDVAAGESDFQAPPPAASDEDIPF